MSRVNSHLRRQFLTRPIGSMAVGPESENTFEGSSMSENRSFVFLRVLMSPKSAPLPKYAKTGGGRGRTFWNQICQESRDGTPVQGVRSGAHFRTNCDLYRPPSAAAPRTPPPPVDPTPILPFLVVSLATRADGYPSIHPSKDEPMV
jgi:hypothetical protein